MIMPSMVSAVRSLFLLSALNAMRTTINTDMTRFLDRRRRRQRPELVFGEPPFRVRPIRDDDAVAERHRPRPVLGDVRLMGDQHHGDSPLAVEALEDIHHLDAGSSIEI